MPDYFYFKLPPIIGQEAVVPEYGLGGVVPFENSLTEQYIEVKPYIADYPMKFDPKSVQNDTVNLDTLQVHVDKLHKLLKIGKDKPFDWILNVTKEWRTITKMWNADNTRMPVMFIDELEEKRWLATKKGPLTNKERARLEELNKDKDDVISTPEQQEKQLTRTIEVLKHLNERTNNKNRSD